MQTVLEPPFMGKKTEVQKGPRDSSFPYLSIPAGARHTVPEFPSQRIPSPTSQHALLELPKRQSH